MAGIGGSYAPLILSARPPISSSLTTPGLRHPQTSPSQSSGADGGIVDPLAYRSRVVFNVVLNASRMRSALLDMIPRPLRPSDAVKRKNFPTSSSANKRLPFVALASWQMEDFGNSNNSKPRQSVFLQKQSPDSEVATMLFHANNGDISEALMMWDELTNSSFIPTLDIVSSLIKSYAKRGYFDEIVGVMNWLKSREFIWLPQAYTTAIHCFGKGGELQLMEASLREMVSHGFPVDSITGNSYLVYYSSHASLRETEAAYEQIKRSRILVEEPVIRSISSAYVKFNKFYELGEFLRDVGLGRRNVGNLLWNLLLLSYAVNFKMKSLQRNFLGMVESGFRPDLTTFNVRSLAFSRMNLFWDLHLSLEHMNHENVAPDLVTYGCVVDAYLGEKMGMNLDFGLDRMINKDNTPYVLTDPCVFEAMGKGDFHSDSEAFMEFSKSERWTYRKLVGIHMKTRFRSRQIFWNY